MQSQHYFLKRTIDANPKINGIFMCFLKLNVYMHSKSIEQFIQLIELIIIYLQKSEFQFKSEILFAWNTIKVRTVELQKQNYAQTYFIEEFIDDFIFSNGILK
jgi:hypothetical protein